MPVSRVAVAADGAIISYEDATFAYVATLTERERDDLTARLRTRLLGDGPDRAFTLNARAWAVRGVVP